jgi:hypothetical protein
MAEITRKIVRLRRGADGLFVEPAEDGPERQRDEQHRRDGAANHFHYADPFTGVTRTYDEEGNYNCGACNQADGTKCLLVKIPRIDRDAGSCGDWEDLCAGDSELVLEYKTALSAGYGVAANGKGFGCHRCPFASRAKTPDSRGRDLWCGKFACRVFAKACCVLNGAPLVKQRRTALYDKT